jgi:hypothetical protein
MVYFVGSATHRSLISVRRSWKERDDDKILGSS